MNIERPVPLAHLSKAVDELSRAVQDAIEIRSYPAPLDHIAGPAEQFLAELKAHQIALESLIRAGHRIQRR